MEKIKLSNNAFVYPMSMVVVGAMVEEKVNYITVAWITRVNASPPLIGVALNKSHYTNKGIHDHQEFSVNIPGLDLLKPVDYAGIFSGTKTDKSELFETFYGELKYAPMIKNCPVTMECKVFQVVDLPANEFFIGEIAGVYTEEKYLTDGKPDVRKMEPFTLTMPDNSYWKMGEFAGKAWNAGKDFRK